MGDAQRLRRHINGVLRSPRFEGLISASKVRAVRVPLNFQKLIGLGILFELNVSGRAFYDYVKSRQRENQ